MNPIVFIGSLLHNVILTLLVALYNLLTLAHFPYALGFAVILLTIVIRIILYPLTSSQYHLSQKQKRLAPHLSKIKEQHKGDSKRIQAETMKLYKEHGVNPAAGCLTFIIQFPILIVLYTVLQKIVSLKPQALVSYINSSVLIPSFKIHSAWDPHFFGIPLGDSPSKLMAHLGIFVFLVPIITAALQYVQSKMIFPSTPKVQLKEGEKKSDDFASAMQTQSLYMFPLMIGVFSFTLPFGMSLYWNTISLFGILQQYKILKEYQTGEILTK